jgi:sugar-specific transcriptional regulator TrmB
MKTGLTRHESLLYIILCKEGELTGYEAAKISGIPRSNAYLALAGLVEKGGAYRIDSEAVRYTAVPAKEFVSNVRRQFEQVLDYIEKNVPGRDLPRDPYISITGKSNIINKMRNMVEQAGQRIYISVSPRELEYVKNELEGARDRGLKVVVITSGEFEMEGVILYRHPKQPGQVRLIVDTAYVLTGEITDRDDCTCLYSQNKNLIQLIKDSLANEIKIVQMQK